MKHEMVNKIKLSDIEPLFPTEQEINKETGAQENSPMMSIAESIHYPDGFRDGVKWTIQKIKENIGIETIVTRIETVSDTDLIIIKEIKNFHRVHQGFEHNTMRWKNCNFKGQHVSEVDFQQLSTGDLLKFYILILTQHLKYY